MRLIAWHGRCKSSCGPYCPGSAEFAVRHQIRWRVAMSFSVNTNTGAQIALQYLNATQGQLDATQGAINSGLKVATAKDDGAIYAIAQNQRGALAGYSSVINSLNNGSSAIDVALSAGQSISDLLIQLKQKALAA